MASTDHRERSYVPPPAGRAGGRAFRYLSFLFVHVAVLPRRRRGSVCPSSVPVPFLHLRTSRVLAPPNLRPPSHGPKSSVPGSSASRQVSNAPSRRISSRCSGYPLSPFLRSHPLQDINSWSFNPFQLNEASEGHALKYVGFELFNRYGFMDRFKVGRLPVRGRQSPSDSTPSMGELFIGTGTGILQTQQPLPQRHPRGRRHPVVSLYAQPDRSRRRSFFLFFLLFIPRLIPLSRTASAISSSWPSSSVP